MLQRRDWIIGGRLVFVALLIVILILLVACDITGPSVRPSGTPTVRATDGAVASVTIIACPPNNSRSETAADLVTILLQSDELVTASGSANARLTINACPPHQFATPAASPQSARR